VPEPLGALAYTGYTVSAIIRTERKPQACPFDSLDRNELGYKRVHSK
jgi:hypothetical protein